MAAAAKKAGCESCEKTRGACVNWLGDVLAADLNHLASVSQKKLPFPVRIAVQLGVDRACDYSPSETAVSNEWYDESRARLNQCAGALRSLTARGRLKPVVESYCRDKSDSKLGGASFACTAEYGRTLENLAVQSARALAAPDAGGLTRAYGCSDAWGEIWKKGRAGAPGSIQWYANFSNVDAAWAAPSSGETRPDSGRGGEDDRTEGLSKGKGKGSLEGDGHGSKPEVRARDGIAGGTDSGVEVDCDSYKFLTGSSECRSDGEAPGVCDGLFRSRDAQDTQDIDECDSGRGAVLSLRTMMDSTRASAGVYDGYTNDVILSAFEMGLQGALLRFSNFPEKQPALKQMLTSELAACKKIPAGVSQTMIAMKDQLVGALDQLASQAPAETKAQDRDSALFAMKCADVVQARLARLAHEFGFDVAIGTEGAAVRLDRALAQLPKQVGKDYGVAGQTAALAGVVGMRTVWSVSGAHLFFSSPYLSNLDDYAGARCSFFQERLAGADQRQDCKRKGEEFLAMTQELRSLAARYPEVRSRNPSKPVFSEIDPRLASYQGGPSGKHSSCMDLAGYGENSQVEKRLKPGDKDLKSFEGYLKRSGTDEIEGLRKSIRTLCDRDQWPAIRQSLISNPEFQSKFFSCENSAAPAACERRQSYRTQACIELSRGLDQQKQAKLVGDVGQAAGFLMELWAVSGGGGFIGPAALAQGGGLSPGIALFSGGIGAGISGGLTAAQNYLSGADPAGMRAQADIAETLCASGVLSPEIRAGVGGISCASRLRAAADEVPSVAMQTLDGFIDGFIGGMGGATRGGGRTPKIKGWNRLALDLELLKSLEGRTDKTSLALRQRLTERIAAAMGEVGGLKGAASIHPVALEKSLRQMARQFRLTRDELDHIIAQAGARRGKALSPSIVAKISQAVDQNVSPRVKRAAADAKLRLEDAVGESERSELHRLAGKVEIDPKNPEHHQRLAEKGLELLRKYGVEGKIVCEKRLGYCEIEITPQPKRVQTDGPSDPRLVSRLGRVAARLQKNKLASRLVLKTDEAVHGGAAFDEGTLSVSWASLLDPSADAFARSTLLHEVEHARNARVMRPLQQSVWIGKTPEASARSAGLVSGLWIHSRKGPGTLHSEIAAAYPEYSFDEAFAYGAEAKVGAARFSRATEDYFRKGADARSVDSLLELYRGRSPLISALREKRMSQGFLDDMLPLIDEITRPGALEASKIVQTKDPIIGRLVEVRLPSGRYFEFPPEELPDGAIQPGALRKHFAAIAKAGRELNTQLNEAETAALRDLERLGKHLQEKSLPTGKDRQLLRAVERMRLQTGFGPGDQIDLVQPQGTHRLTYERTLGDQHLFRGPEGMLHAFSTDDLTALHPSGKVKPLFSSDRKIAPTEASAVALELDSAMDEPTSPGLRSKKGPSGGTRSAAVQTPKSDGFGARSAAFDAAKRDAGIPASAQPVETRRVPMTKKVNGVEQVIRDERGQAVMSREYVFRRDDGKVIVIQDHSGGHEFGEGGVGDQGPHFNVRPAADTRNGKVPGTLEHYGFEKKKKSK